MTAALQTFVKPVFLSAFNACNTPQRFNRLWSSSHWLKLKIRRSPLLHSASGSLVLLAEAFAFDSHIHFCLFFFFCLFFLCFSFIVRHAALHGTRPRTRSSPPTTPLPPPSPFTPPHDYPSTSSRTDSWADGRVRSTRSMGGAAHAPSKLLLPDLPPGVGQARGLSAGTHPSPDQPTTPLPLPPLPLPPTLWSQICLIGWNTRRKKISKFDG